MRSACEEAEAILAGLASTYSSIRDPKRRAHGITSSKGPIQGPVPKAQLPNLEAKYHALRRAIPAVVFMAYLDRGIGEAYVSPQIEATLGFSQAEWLEDPVRGTGKFIRTTKQRWSVEASEMFLSGKPLRSAYRVVARDGRVIWFHCEAKMIRHPDGQPWFIQGVAFDITDLKRTEEELQEERNVVSAILDTVGALVVVLDREGRIVRFNRACEQMTGHIVRTGARADAFGTCSWSRKSRSNSRRLFQADLRSTQRAPNMRARGLRATAVTERLPGRLPCCLPRSRRPCTSSLRGSTSPSKSGHKRSSADCWRRRRTRSWWSIRRGRSFW